MNDLKSPQNCNCANKGQSKQSRTSGGRRTSNRNDSVPAFSPAKTQSQTIFISDHGPEPYAANIRQATLQNQNFRTAFWTGTHLQMTLMLIPPGGEIGLEVHPEVDQFLYIEMGQGMFRGGNRQDTLNLQANVSENSGIFVPAGTWHNVINTQGVPLKLFSIYAPPQHPSGTVHHTKAEAEAAESIAKV